MACACKPSRVTFRLGRDWSAFVVHELCLTHDEREPGGWDACRSCNGNGKVTAYVDADGHPVWRACCECEGRRLVYVVDVPSTTPATTPPGGGA